MKTFRLLSYFIATLLLGNMHITSAANYTWTGNSSTAWNVASNWSPSTGFPGSSDNVTIVSATNQPQLDQNRTINALTVNSGTFDLNSYTLTVNGNANFNSGTVQNGILKPRGNQGNFAGTQVDSKVDAVCGSIKLSGGVFNNVCYFEDLSQANSAGDGGCIFNDSLTIKHTGTNGKLFKLAITNGDVYNGPVTLINESDYEIWIAIADSNYFNDNIIVNNTGSDGITFGINGGYSELASGKTISIGSNGFTKDILTLHQFYQKGSTSQSLSLTDSASVTISFSEFNGPLTISAPGFLIKNNTFKGATSFTKTGTSNYHSYGGNVFSGYPNLIANSGTAGRIRLASTEPDLFNENISFESSGQAIQVAYSGLNEFKANITINNSNIVFNAGTGTVGMTGPNESSINPYVSVKQFLLGNSNYAFYKFKINKEFGSVLTYAPCSIDDSLILVNGLFSTDTTNILTMKAGSAVTGASNSSFVSGPVKKYGNTAFVFPIGSGVYRPLTITAPSETTDAFVGQFFDEEQNLGTEVDTVIDFLSDCMYWMFDRKAGSSNVYLKFDWDSAYCWSVDTTHLILAKWNNPTWESIEDIGLYGDRFGGQIMPNNPITSFGYFTFASTYNSNTTCGTLYEVGSTGNVLLASDLLTDPTLTSNGLINGSTLTTLGFNSPITVSILGDLFIDVSDFTFEKANIFMDQNSTINFQSVNDLTFSIVESHVQGCKARDMWQGINIDGTYTNSLEIKLGSVIEDAEIAIFSNHGGEFHVNNSILNKNFIGIELSQFNSVHPSTFINNSQIKCSTVFSNLVPGTLRSPHLGQIPDAGIDCPNIVTTGSWIIGDGNHAQNLFYNLSNGIRAEDWDLTINNNKFLDNGNGISVFHDYQNGAGNAEILVGVGSLDNMNEFENCVNGIIASHYSCEIENNSFLLGNTCISLSNTSIAGYTPTVVDITIHNNIFTNFSNRGIYTVSVTRSTTFEISENTFTRDVNLPNGTTGIWIGGSLAQPTNHLLIRDNEFNNIRWGILLNSLSHVTANLSKPRNIVRDNVFNFSNTNVVSSNPDFVGIRMVNSRSVWLSGNEFYRFNGNATSEANDMYGILTNNSIFSTINFNTFNDFGTGLFMNTTNSGAQLHCNLFTDNFQSIRLGQTNAMAVLSNQGSSTLAWDNVWDGNLSTNNVIGNSNVFTWFYRDPAGSNPYEPINNLGLILVDNINATTICPLTPPAIAPDRDKIIKPFIQDSVSYSDHVNENRWMGYANAYWALMDDTTLIVQSFPNDSIYVNFVNNISTTNIGYFYQLGQLTAEDNYENASTLLSSITDTNTIESNLKAFYEIYLETVMLGIVPDSYDTTALYSIAEQRFLEGGPAVWMARHLLDLEIEDDYSEDERIGIPYYEKYESKSNFIHLVNPANHYLYLPSEYIYEESSYELFNCLGTLIMNSRLQADTRAINISHLSDGVYFLKILMKGGQQKIGKIIVQNE